MTGLLLRDAELDGRLRVDVRIVGGRVSEVAPVLERRPGEAVHDCRGGALLPGLCDHHVHLHALAAWRGSVRCGPPEVTGRDGLAAALAAAVPDGHGWIRGVGYAETVAGDLDAAALDRLRADRPVRVQHRSGALWILNTAALRAVGADGGDHPGVERDGRGRPTGRLWRADDWLRSRLPRTGPPDLAPVGTTLIRHGVTAVTDATPDLDAGAIAAITAAMRRGALPQRVHLLGVPLGDAVPGDDGGPEPVTGPYKIVLADSGLPAYDELADRIRAAHAAGRAVAVHCVTREALVLLLAALDDTGPLPGDRIEHAALVPPELVPDIARLGLRVVTQPGFLAHRGDDYLRDVPPEDRPDLYRCATFRHAGIPLALSSDAPYGPLDPWAVIAAATTRRTPSGQVAGPDERLTFGQALDAYLAPPDDPGGPPRRVRPGLPADLIVLRVPLAHVPDEPNPVRAVLTGGDPVLLEDPL
ncbi:Predicted amidohydrolase YtcJ [Thermomonospora echinospora]|uniref:Predicted amidohydrolase YtcJ n=1 Tax=Thermomonospora echinospora TaxID=1992 RepID=A0A1H5SYZ6_9ACTN|nr:amidohydrolase family protein [Thermomonospora echinospora]SEF55739.1 Predicted amidohydrolase YtcJ [Thermomonospora echinospora]